MKTYKDLMEKTLTPAELKKREEIAKAMEKETPGMNMGKKMAIATAAAKRVAESDELAEGEYKSRHIHRQEQNKKYDEYRSNQESQGKKPLSRGDWAAIQRKGNKGLAEGIGDTIKRGVKSVKRGMAGWGSPHADAPGEIVKRNKGYDDKTVQRLNLRGKIYKDVDGAPDPHSPQGLQNRVLDREMKKRGLGGEGVAEGLSKRDQKDVDAIKAAIAGLQDKLKQPNADKEKIQQTIANEKKRLALYEQFATEETMTVEEQAPEAPSIGVHRIAVTTSEPDHPAVSKRKETTQRFVRVTAQNKEKAIEQGKKHFKKKGYKVHDAEHVGMIHEEVEDTMQTTISFKEFQAKLDEAGAYQKDMDEKKPVFAQGVKGVKSKPFVKKFKSQQHYEKWAESDAAGDHEVHHVYQEEVEIDGEQLDELNKSTLGSYVKKATRSTATNAWKAGTHTAFDPKAQEDERSKAFVKANKRMSGVNKAVDRLTKEEVESIDEVNHREFAEAGKMHPTMAKHMKTGSEIDFYSSENGDKLSGKVTKNDGKHVHVQANKDGKVGGGKTHKFAVSKNLNGQIHEENELDEEYTGKGNHRPGWMLRADASLKKKIDAAKKKREEKKNLLRNGPVKEELELDEADYDWSKVGAWGRRTDKGSSIDWNSDKKSTSTDTGTVHKAREVTRNPEGGEVQKRGRGRPAGEYKGTYKARDPEGKAASAAKAQASKADGLAARKEFKTSMDAAIRQRQLEIWKKASKAAK